MNPFDDLQAEVRVVIDNHGHPCLWPADCPVPFGWTTALCPAPRHEAQTYLDRHHSTLASDDDERSLVHRRPFIRKDRGPPARQRTRTGPSLTRRRH